MTLHNGEVYAFDLATAQYSGYDGAVIPWDQYASARIRSIDETLAMGEIGRRMNILRETTTGKPRRMLECKKAFERLSLRRGVDLWEVHHGPISKMLKLEMSTKGDEFLTFMEARLETFRKSAIKDGL